MARMIRKQIDIDEFHEQKLQRLARERGVTESEIVCEAIDRVESPEAPAKNKRSEAARKFFELADEVARRRAGEPRQPRWTRDSLYEERIGRWTKS